jgi:hypothetical protein
MKKKTMGFWTMVAAVVLLGNLLVSCISTGRSMPLSPGETVIGTVQVSFLGDDVVTARGRDSISVLAYIKLLETARGRYEESVSIDIRDIIWGKGREYDSNVEYTATGKVIQVK